MFQWINKRILIGTTICDKNTCLIVSFIVQALLGPSVSYSSLSLPLSPVAIKEKILSTLNTQTHTHIQSSPPLQQPFLVVSSSLSHGLAQMIRNYYIVKERSSLSKGNGKWEMDPTICTLSRSCSSLLSNL